MCYRTDAYATAFFRSNRYIPTASGTKYSGSTLRPSCGGKRERERERERETIPASVSAIAPQVAQRVAQRTLTHRS